MTHFDIDTYAVMGNPIAHSKSPLIHTQFAKQTGEQLRYIAIEAPFDSFKETILDFQQHGGKGLNITVPFKLQAWQWVDERSQRAELAGAVNTISFKDNGKLFGDNTDGVGLINDIVKNENISLANKNILIIGAGGAAQGVLAPLLAEKPNIIFIANRTAEKATNLAEQFRALGSIKGGDFKKLEAQSFDLIINATSAGLKGELPALPSSIITRTTVCYDMAYGNKPTVFMEWAKQHGARKCLDGLGMLVEQAAEAFYLWRGIKPKTQPVINLLRHPV